MDSKEIRDIRLKAEISVAELVSQMSNAGFQGTELGKAVEVVKRMKKEKTTVFLCFTANMVASGLRGLFADLTRVRFIDVIITTGGAIDHDLIKAYKHYEIGSFDLDDRELHKAGINRLGNILISNDRYELLEQLVQPIFLHIMKEESTISPSELCRKIGLSIKDEGSFLYWASRNEIPVFCPGITDSAIGLQAFFFKQDNPDFKIDVTADMKQLADIVFEAEKTGAMILGGGIAKHYTIGANLLRGGLDYAIYITTAVHWDGSLSGARTREAISWGKIKEMASHVTVYGDAVIIFPLIMAKVLSDLGIRL
ncbi:MAG: deoxyhypusine synthase [Thermoproteota archaeon]|nr:MAG: deoxyhypusine synthase [Candidatus Korarchaeota archaeon]